VTTSTRLVLNCDSAAWTTVWQVRPVASETTKMRSMSL